MIRLANRTNNEPDVSIISSNSHRSRAKILFGNILRKFCQFYFNFSLRMNKILAILRLFVVVFYVSSFWYDVTYIGCKFDKRLEELNLVLQARWIYLTQWNMVSLESWNSGYIQGFSFQFLFTLYFFIAFLNDVIGTNEISSKEQPLIRRLKDSLFSLACPLSLFISTAFWSIYAFDRELIFPRALDSFVPG